MILRPQPSHKLQGRPLRLPSETPPRCPQPLTSRLQRPRGRHAPHRPRPRSFSRPVIPRVPKCPPYYVPQEPLPRHPQTKSAPHPRPRTADLFLNRAGGRRVLRPRCLGRRDARTFASSPRPPEPAPERWIPLPIGQHTHRS